MEERSRVEPVSRLDEPGVGLQCGFRPRQEAGGLENEREGSDIGSKREGGDENFQVDERCERGSFDEGSSDEGVEVENESLRHFIEQFEGNKWRKDLRMETKYNYERVKDAWEEMQTPPVRLSGF